MEPQEKQDNTMKYIGIVVVAVLALGLAWFLFFKDNSTDVETGTTPPVAEKPVTEETDKAEEMVMKEAEAQIALIRSEIESLVPHLSAEGQLNLEIVREFIASDPTAILEDPSTYPEEVETAFVAVVAEFDAIDKTLVLLTDPNSAAIVAKILEDEKDAGVAVPEVNVGDVGTILGVLEVESDDETNPLGTVYKVQDIEINMPFWFVFWDEPAAAAEALIGKEVAITVQVTEVDPEDSEFKVLYDVTAGPVELTDEMKVELLEGVVVEEEVPTQLPEQ